MELLISQIVNSLLIGAILGVLIGYNLRLTKRIRELEDASEKFKDFIINCSGDMKKIVEAHNRVAGRVTVMEQHKEEPQPVIADEGEEKKDPFAKDVENIMNYSPSPQKRMEQKRRVE